jgi:anaphase-promoting complex subunit 8
MRRAFIIHVSTELVTDSFKTITEKMSTLINEFPRSSHLQGQNARLHYIYQSKVAVVYIVVECATYTVVEYPLAAKLFNSLYETNPFMLDFVEDYANILHVLQDVPKLSYLAQRCSSIDRYRPESCIVIGMPVFTKLQAVDSKSH